MKYNSSDEKSDYGGGIYKWQNGQGFGDSYLINAIAEGSQSHRKERVKRRNDTGISDIDNAQSSHNDLRNRLRSFCQPKFCLPRALNIVLTYG